MCTSLRFRVRERPEKYFLLSAWRRELDRPGPQFFIIWQTWIYTHGIFRSVILVSIFMLQTYITFSLFLKIWLIESILIFREQVFRVTYFLWTSNTLRHKLFLIKISSFHDVAYICKEKVWLKVTGKYQMSWSAFFKESVILLYQSISETRRISHLYGSAIFTVSLRNSAFCLIFVTNLLKMLFGIHQ